MESLADHRVIFRSWRESLAGHVYMTGRARRAPDARPTGQIRVYRRDGITFPLRAAAGSWAIGSPFTGLLQGIHTRADQGRNSAVG